MDVITFPVNLYTTSGVSILLHGVISLSDATSYDKACFMFNSHENKICPGHMLKIGGDPVFI